MIANRRVMELNLAGHVIDEMTDEEVASFNPPLPVYQRVINVFSFFWVSKIFYKHELFRVISKPCT